MGLLDLIGDKFAKDAQNRLNAGKDTIRPSDRNRLLGLLADAVQGANDFASQPFGYNNPPAKAILGLLGTPAVANTLNEMSYGGALGTGKGMTWKPKPDTIDAAMVAAPLAMAAPAVINKTAAAVGKAVAPAVERAVPAIMERGGLPAQFLQDMSKQTVSPLTVWHGSPHKFDKFDASKIGTGEGAQAYGHGLYVAESPEVAGTYKAVGTDASYNRVTGGMTPMEEFAFDKASQGLKGEDLFSAMQQRYGGMLKSDADFDAFDQAIKKAEASAGNLYKIDLPDEHIDKMLDWDKPLSEQHPDVQKAITPMFGPNSVNLTGQELYKKASSFDAMSNVASKTGGDIEKMRAVFPRATDAELQQAIAKSKNAASNDSIAAQMLRDAGIPGIRYLDGGSRGTGAGTSNFVIFPKNEGLLTILERNGQPIR